MMPATTEQETPFFVRADGEDVFAILTAPTAPARGVAAIILSGGAYVGATNRNRVSVRMARDLAARGFHAVRMDYHGVGDSTGEIDLYPLHRPFVADLLAVIAHVRAQGIEHFILIGTTCFGARTALAGAGRVSGLEGVVSLAAPIRDFPFTRDPAATPTQVYVKRAFSRSTLEGLRDPRRRRAYAAIVATKARTALGRARRTTAAASAPTAPSDGMSPGFYEPLAALAERGVPVLIGYGEQDDYYGEFTAARQSPRLRALLEAPGSRFTLRTVAGSIHALRRIGAQDAMIEMTQEWLDELDRKPVRAA
jgi:alpha/beta superfamily hydrolase